LSVTPQGADQGRRPGAGSATNGKTPARRSRSEIEGAVVVTKDVVPAADLAAARELADWTRRDIVGVITYRTPGDRQPLATLSGTSDDAAGEGISIHLEEERAASR
jgi:hypothetical protein